MSGGVVSVGAGDVAESLRRTADRVAAANNVAKRGVELDTEPGTVHGQGVVREPVTGPPTWDDLVSFESFLDGVDAAIRADVPSVALHVDPGVRCRRNHACSVEGIADDRSAGGALFDVDVLRGRV